nr:hypothetical protein [Anaerolinea sp.]
MKVHHKHVSPRTIQSGVVAALMLFFLLAAPVFPVTRVAQADAPVQPLTGPTWYDGLIQYSQITNCVSIIQGYPYIENGVGTFVGFLADPDNAVPSPNQTYYLRVYIAGLGNSCSGMRAYLDVSLPANTSLAITPTDKVYCLFDGAPINPASDCPQTLPPSSYNLGAFAIYSTDTAHAYTWPVPQGHTIEFQIPVKSSTALTNSTFRANIWMLDGNSSPWIYPQQGVYVFSATPSILYPSPSTINITPTGGRSQAYLYTHGLGGTGYFDLGTSAAYGLVHEAVVIPAGGNAFLAWDDWGPPTLTPDTLYHWRFTFTDSNGASYIGADQTFNTLPDGRVTVGSGASAGCTESALNTALAGAKEIIFNCGVLPVTIPLTSPKTISTNLVIDGGNKVTLDGGGSASFFNVQSGAHLTLKKITLSNGFNTSACGGAVNVPAGAQLSVDEARFIHNQAYAQGGAICNSGTADVTGAFFVDNATLASHGGGIGNYGTMTIANS